MSDDNDAYVKVLMDRCAKLKIRISDNVLITANTSSYPTGVQYLITTELSQRYRERRTEYFVHTSEKPTPDAVNETINDQDVRQVFRIFAENQRNNSAIASLDAVFDISGIGEQLIPIGFDTVFVNMAKKRGVSLAQLRELTCLDQRRADPDLHSVCNIVRQSRTNLPEHKLKELFPRHYRNVNRVKGPVADALMPFEGCNWGRKPLAYNFYVGSWLYASSNMPNIMSDNKLPEAVMASIKGMRVNEIVDGSMFGDEQTVINARYANGKTQIMITPSIVELQPHSLPLAA